MKLNPLTYANFNLEIFPAAILSKITWKVPKMDFLFNQAYHIILQTYKLTFMSAIFNVHRFPPTKIIFLSYYERTYHSLHFVIFSIFFFFNLNVLLITHLPFNSIAVSTSFFFPIWESTWNSNFVFNFIFIFVNRHIFILPIIIFLAFIILNNLFVLSLDNIEVLYILFW